MRLMNYVIAVGFFFMAADLRAQNLPLSQQMAATVMEIWKDSLNLDPEKPKAVKWAYDQGVVLEGIDGLWRRTGNGEYFRYMQKSMDFFVTKEGQISRYKASDYNIDHVKNGRTLLTLYKVTGQQKYFKAATLLREQLKTHPRTKQGGFWHKKIYPYQMWLDGLYMAQPFYTEYAVMMKEKEAFEDIVNQLSWMENHARDTKTGLLYHGWDESRQEQWAHKVTGRSPNFWGRAMGWYGMALVDVLENFPKDHPRQAEIVAILNRLVNAIEKVQDPSSGLWYDILDKPDGEGNYFEASAAAMFVYTIAKGVRLGFLPPASLVIAQKGYAGIEKTFIAQRGPGKVDLKGTVTVSGLGGKPYRDGSYAYYMSERVMTNDPKGVGAFLLAANEMEWAYQPKPAKGKRVTLDSYFNHELKKDVAGKDMSWHYKWEERANGGFSFLADQFQEAGFQLSTLYQAPTVASLKKSQIYIIVDPDHEKDSPQPNLIEANSVKVLKNWVRKGGILLLMANDSANVELKQFNKLAKEFGVYFKGDNKGTVPVAGRFETAKVVVPKGNLLFRDGMSLFIKEYSTLELKEPALAALKDKDGDVVMAISRYGRGLVFCIGDPWLYNEYVDGRKLPADYENWEAGKLLINWMVRQLR